ncbi:MAG TPA: DUF1318 domain-containing protein [Leptospiraceae bacterium]|nr:DUF1318 domain-containing protein [Leptospiraceae bacterium]HRG76385.1 DUF1318 domain-containing protein [Leptospiraceae bacterium]
MNMDKRKIKIAWKQIQIFRFTLRDFVKAQIFQRIMQRSQTLCLCGSVAILLLSSNCTTLRPPAITFTQSQTAAERQMIGEGKDLEKDGWIISSIRTSASGSDIWEKEILDKEIPEGELDEATYTALKRIAYLSKDVRNFKKKDFIGEALDGQIKINPLVSESRFKKEFPENKSKIEELLKLVNESRKIIYENKLQRLSNANLKEQELLKKKDTLLLTYYQTVEDGEYYEAKRGKWGRKE